MTWADMPEPKFPPISTAGWLRVAIRGLPLLLLFACGLAVFGLARLTERFVARDARPASGWVAQVVCRGALMTIGISYSVRGAPMMQAGAVVANHSSWLDIFALNAGQQVFFVSKAEVAAWPGIGWIVQAAGTLFIRRDRRDAAAQKAMFEERLHAGHKLLFFPEGTSSDGQRILPFKSTLFAAFFVPGLLEISHIQPASLTYRAPADEAPSFYGWWGEMEFGAHFLQMLSAPRHGSVSLVLHPPLVVADFDDRKALAAACEAAVRGNLDLRL